MKSIMRVLFCVSVSAGQVYARTIPNPGSLRPITHIADSASARIIAQYPDLLDLARYGERPRALRDADLQTLNTTCDWNNLSSYGIKSSKELYVAQIHGAFVSPTYLGTVFDEREQLLFDIGVSPGYPIFWPVGGEVARFPCTVLPKLATVQGPTFFYHWVIDRLPSVLLLRDTLRAQPDMKLLINVNTAQGRIAGYVHEYLDLLGIPRAQRLEPAPNMVYYAETLHFATPFLMEPIPRPLLLKLRDELVAAAYARISLPQYHDNLIVVVQRREPDRRIANLPELLAMLRTIFDGTGYHVMTFDASMSVAEQIQIFNNARLVIGVMASGLTNVLYMKPGTTVIEIHPSLPYVVNAQGVNNAGNEWCWWLASAVGAQYWVLPQPFALSHARVACPLDELQNILTAVRNSE